MTRGLPPTDVITAVIPDHPRRDPHPRPARPKSLVYVATTQPPGRRPERPHPGGSHAAGSGRPVRPLQPLWRAAHARPAVGADPEEPHGAGDAGGRLRPSAA